MKLTLTEFYSQNLIILIDLWNYQLNHSKLTQTHEHPVVDHDQQPIYQMLITGDFALNSYLSLPYPSQWLEVELLYRRIITRAELAKITNSEFRPLSIDFLNNCLQHLNRITANSPELQSQLQQQTSNVYFTMVNETSHTMAIHYLPIGQTSSCPILKMSVRSNLLNETITNPVYQSFFLWKHVLRSYQTPELIPTISSTPMANLAYVIYQYALPDFYQTNHQLTTKKLNYALEVLSQNPVIRSTINSIQKTLDTPNTSDKFQELILFLINQQSKLPTSTLPNTGNFPCLASDRQLNKWFEQN